MTGRVKFWGKILPVPVHEARRIDGDPIRSRPVQISHLSLSFFKPNCRSDEAQRPAFLSLVQGRSPEMVWCQEITQAKRQ